MRVARKLNLLPTDVVSMKQGCCSAATFVQGCHSWSRSPASAFRHETCLRTCGSTLEDTLALRHIRMSWLVCRFVTGYSRILAVRDTDNDTAPLFLNPLLEIDVACSIGNIFLCYVVIFI